MIEVTAVVGNMEVVASGAIHVCGESIIAKVNGMGMEIKFIVDSSTSETKFYTRLDGNTLVLTLSNFFSALPEGQFEPNVVGFVDGRSLLMAFSVVTFDKDRFARLFSYTFYLGAENQ